MSHNSTIPAGFKLNYYGYDPSEAGAYISTALFGILFAISLFLNFRHKSWWLMSIPIAALMETLGFALRPTASYSLGKYIMSTLFILLAPTIYAIADYALIGRIMVKTGIHHPIFKPDIVRRVFLGADITSFLIQVSGGGLTAISNQDIAITGSKVLLAGLSISLCVFAFFLFLLTFMFIHLRNSNAQNIGKSKVIMVVLFIDMLLLILRSAYRVAEYGDLQFHNPISTNEKLFYGCDMVEMFLLNLLWVPFHPGFWNMLDDTTDEEDPKTTEALKIKSIDV